MKKGFEIRTRKAGDYIIVDDEDHHKKLKQVLQVIKFLHSRERGCGS